MNAVFPVHAGTQPGRPGFPWLVGGAIALALGFLAGAIILTQGQLREELRSQLAHRDAQGLAVLVQKQLANPSNRDDPNPLPALLETLMLPDLPSVRDVQIFDERHRPTLHLVQETDSGPPSERQFSEVTKQLAEIVDAEAPRALPWAVEFRATSVGPRLNVLLGVSGAGPYQPASPRPAPALAAFTLDASSLAAEYVQLDQALHRRNWLTFGLLGAAMSAALGLAFQRLIHTQRMLQQHTARLEAANRELNLSAKAGALGTVTAHLVHGLKNPLAGLQQFLQSSHPGTSDASRADAESSARRMKAMIDDVVRVLRDEQGLTAFEIPTSELLAHVEHRCAGPARERGVELRCGTSLTFPLSNRTANLAALILENLVINGLQAAPAGGSVEVTASATDHPGALQFEVRDNGPGLPPAIRERLFEPGASTKAQGTGLGLALSRQLARSLSGTLALARSNAQGTAFTLGIPIQPPARVEI